MDAAQHISAGVLLGEFGTVEATLVSSFFLSRLSHVPGAVFKQVQDQSTIMGWRWQSLLRILILSLSLSITIVPPNDPGFFHGPFSPELRSLEVSAYAILDREQILIDSLLLRFRNIVELAPIAEGCVTKEAAAAQSFQIQVETAALIRACEDLLKLTRELKEMWLVGPLRGIGKRDDEAEKRMDENVEKVGKMIEELFIKEN